MLAIFDHQNHTFFVEIYKWCQKSDQKEVELDKKTLQILGLTEKQLKKLPSNWFVRILESTNICTPVTPPGVFTVVDPEGKSLQEKSTKSTWLVGGWDSNRGTHK